MHWTNISAKDIICLRSKGKKDIVWKDMHDPNGDAKVVITTYAMISKNRENCENEFINAIKRREWGLCVADECHMLPADHF